MIVRIALAVGVLMFAVTGCIGDNEPDLVTGDDMTEAFAAAGERLKPRPDLNAARKAVPDTEETSDCR